MNFIGRITATFPFCLLGIWLVIHNYHHQDGLTNFFISVVIGISAIIIAWIMGGQFDKARFYYKELATKKSDLQQVFDSVDATIWTNDLVEKRIYVSKGVERISGYSAKQFYEDYDFWTTIFYPEDESKAEEFYKKVISGESSYFEGRIFNAGGEPIWVYLSGTPIFDKETNEVIKVTGVVIDISDRKRMQSMLQESESRYRSVVELSPNLILIHQEGKIVYANPEAARLAGVGDSSNLIGKSIFEFIHPSSREKVAYRNREIIENRRGNDFSEYKIVRLDGTILYIEMLGSKIDYNGTPCVLVVGIDVTAKKEYQEKMEFMAYHDPLTELPNRHMYNEYLEKAMARSKRSQETLAVMFIDLDRFKYINDTMGHEAGDELLKQASARLIQSVREDDLVSRQGGDEFAILLEDTNKAELRKISNRILKAFSHPFTIKNREIYTSPSIGISLYPMDGDDRESINSKADIAMYLAKKRGKNTYEFFNPEQGEIMDRSNKLEHDLRKAIDNKEFYLVYQPKVELKNGRIYAVEALVRWNHPELGTISPIEFIPIAEESGMIVLLGEWILGEACRQNKKWQDLGIKIKMAVNVSALQFEARDFVHVVKDTLEKHQLEPQYLGLEITESVVQNINSTCNIIEELKSIGVKISIDDFGTGYSSLSVLSKLKIDYVKIDKSFISEILVRPNISSLVKTMIDMGGNLNFELIAEGIETKEQADFLMENNCRYGQGYYFSKPLSVEEADKTLIESLGLES